MHFALFYEIVDNFAEKRTPYREKHLAKVKEAHRDGRLVLAGAFAEPVDGALLVFRGQSPEVAEEFAKADPYVTSGLVTKWRVRQWATVIGDGATMPSLPDATGFPE
jgi:uncharacterized protein YciI